MNIFVFGSSGMLGRYVYKYLRPIYPYVVSVNRNELDITTVTKRKLYSSNIGKGDWVINCAGTISQRKEASAMDFITVNSLFPHLLQEVCNHRGAKLIHITTDCVFKGDIGGYNEESEHDATDIYGRTKSIGEPKDATIIRTSIIGEELNNRLSFIEWVKSNKGGSINGFVDHIWNGITCLQFAKICESLINGNIFWEGVKHVFSPSEVDKYELATIIDDIYGLNINIVPAESAKACDRTLSTIRKDVIINTQGIYDQILEQKEFSIQ